MWIFILVQQSAHMSLGRMFKSRAAIPERRSSVHPKGGNFKEIVCCQAEGNNSVLKLQKLLSLTEIWSKILTTEGLLKAFQTVEIDVFFSDLFFHLFLKQMLKGVHCSSASKRAVLWGGNWLHPVTSLFSFSLSLLFCF